MPLIEFMISDGFIDPVTNSYSIVNEMNKLLNAVSTFMI